MPFARFWLGSKKAFKDLFCFGVIGTVVGFIVVVVVLASLLWVFERLLRWEGFPTL